MTSYILKLNEKISRWNFIKILICLNPLFFSLFVILTDFVDYKGVFESAKYISIAQNWLNSSSNIVTPERLPVYPLFITFTFKIFGENNLIALLLCQSILGILSFYYLIQTLEKLRIGNNLIILLTLLFNLSINYRFTVFLPNCLFIFMITLFIFNFTSFYLSKNKINFYCMCFFIFLMMLTRPIFQLSIILTIPIIIYFILSQKFSNFSKFQLISVLILSYFLSIGVQFARYYDTYGNFAYTTQSGIHLNKWVIPCLSQKYGCGSRDMIVHTYLENKYQNEISTNAFNEVEKNKIAMSVGLNYFLIEMDKKKTLISIFFSYAKLLIHSSLVEIYPAFNINFKNFSLLEGETLLEKLNNLAMKTFTEPKYFFWTLSLFFLINMRFIQLIGIVSIFKNNSNKLYILLIISLIIVILIPAIGMGNPRYRSEIEPLLLILGAIGIQNIFDYFKAKN